MGVHRSDKHEHRGSNKGVPRLVGRQTPWNLRLVAETTIIATCLGKLKHLQYSQWRKTTHTAFFLKLHKQHWPLVNYFQLFLTLSTISSDTCSWPMLFPLHKQPLSLNCRYHRKMLCLHGDYFPYCLKQRCTAIINELFAYYRTQKFFSCFASFTGETELDS